MSELQSNRRRQAQRELGLTDEHEQAQLERALHQEEERQRKKELRRMEIEESSAYQATQTIAKWMDKYFLDPILGFILPAGIGDTLTSIFVIPYIYVAVCKVRSFPLTLAVIFNVLRDVALGLIPFCIGDIIDTFNRSYVQNARLIVGFVEDDKSIIEEVNRKAFWTGVLILIFCAIIYLLVRLAIQVGSWIGSLF